MRPVWRLPRELTLLLILAELLAAAEGDRRPPRVAGRPGRARSAPPPRLVPQARGSLAGRRPRG